ncbi:MAG: hypothetical protein AAF637_07875 [Pseudomonadota bacterium]
MVYLILQIVGFLIAAAAIGFAVGWLCRSLTAKRRDETSLMQAHGAQSELEGKREQLEARLAEAGGERKALEEQLAQAREAAEVQSSNRRQLEREHRATMVKLEAREREVARLNSELEVARRDNRPSVATSTALSTPAQPASLEPEERLVAGPRSQG